MYLNVGKDILDMMMVGGVLTPINKDECGFDEIYFLIDVEVQ